MPDIAYDLDFIILVSPKYNYRVLVPDIAYDLDFIILASPDNCQCSCYQRDLVANTTLYCLL